MPELTRESLIEAAKAAAEKAGPDLSRADFMRVTGITDHQIARLFPEGRWSEVKRLAGLDRHPKHNAPLDDEAIIREFHRVASELGKFTRGMYSPTRQTFLQTLCVVASVGCRVH